MINSMMRSKTVWLGVLVAFIPVLQALQALPMSPEMSSLLTSILGGLVVINRFYTNVPLSEK